MFNLGNLPSRDRGESQGGLLFVAYTAQAEVVEM